MTWPDGSIRNSIGCGPIVRIQKAICSVSCFYSRAIACGRKIRRTLTPTLSRSTRRGGKRAKAIGLWETRNALQRAIAVSVLRGHDSPDKVAQNLHITVEEVSATLPGVWGLLLDRYTDKIWIK